MRTRTGTAVCGDPSDPIELFYEDLGDPAGAPVLLIMGVGAQLPMWPDGFCELLIERGYRVIRYDHRDIGLSTKMVGQKAHGAVYARVVRYALGRRSPVPYTLVDMAEDARALWDNELRASLRALRLVVSPHSRVLLWLGDAEIGGRRLPADVQLAQLAPEAGFQLVASAVQMRLDPRGGRPRGERLLLLQP